MRRPQVSGSPSNLCKAQAGGPPLLGGSLQPPAATLTPLHAPLQCCCTQAAQRHPTAIACAPPTAAAGRAR